MAVPSAVVIAESVFSAMEPTAGIALAINLAYLNLPVLRYRLQIRDTSTERLKSLRSHPGSDDSVNHLDQLNDMQFLAEEEGAHRPRSAVIWWYQKLLVSRADIFLSIAFSIYAAVVIFVGAAHSAGLWNILPRSLPLWATGIVFHILAAAVLVPPALIALGRMARKWADIRSAHCAEQIAQLFENKAARAEPPTIPREQILEAIRRVRGEGSGGSASE